MLSFLKTAYSRLPIFIRVMQISSILNFVDFKENSTNIDVGCGDGWISKKMSHLLPCSASLYSIDWNKSSHMYIKDKDFIQSDIHQLPFKDSSVDFVLLSSVLQVVPDDVKLLKEMYRVINDKGKLVITVPTGYPIIEELLSNSLVEKLMNFTKKRKISYQTFKAETSNLYKINGKGFYSVEQIKYLLQDNGFKVIECKKSPGTVGAFIFQFLIFIRYVLGMKKLTSKMDLVFLPLLSLEKFFVRDSVGIELVIRLEKIVRQSKSEYFR